MKPGNEQRSAVDRHVEFAARHWREHHYGAEHALRCGLSDAAHLIDCMILDRPMPRRGTRLQAREMETRAALKAAADAIWQLREKV